MHYEYSFVDLIMQKNEYSQLPLRGAKTEALCDINLWEKKLSTFSLEENDLNLYIPLRWMEMSPTV